MDSCSHIKADGERCAVRNDLSPETGLCIWHDPERREKAQEARRRGGQGAGSRSRSQARTVEPHEAPPTPQTIEDCARWAAWLTVAVTTGQLDARTCKEAVNAINALRGALEKHKLEKDLGELREQFDALRKRTGMRAS